MANMEQKSLINELSQGKELARQLMINLQQPCSQEKRDLLVGQILSSYEKALSMLNHANHKDSKTNNTSSESPQHSLGNTSPRSVFFDQDTATPSDVYKKRKTMPKWTEKVKVCLATGIEGPLEDGYSWRKYGQKDILGSNHPRGYYRCTHRNSQGCLATKQVQKSDQDSSLFEVTYRGRHTCSPSSQLPKQCLNKEEKSNLPQLEEKKTTPIIQSQPQSTLSELKARLGVKTEEGSGDIIFPPFSFPPTPIESDATDYPFSEAIMERTFGGGFSPPFLSPAASETDPWHVTSFGLGNINYNDNNNNNNNNNVLTSESDLSEILSAPTSVANSPPIGDLDFTIENVDFESNFAFDSAEFFS